MIKTIIILLVLVSLALIFFFFSRQEEPQEFNLDQAREIASEWIKNNSPTYLFDGENLELVTEETIIENSVYSFLFKFQSRNAGYGDREDQITASVITNHEMEIIVDNNEVVKAVTDNVYSEIEKRMISAPKESLVKIKVFFGKEEDILEIERTVPSTSQIARKALSELILGPTFDEKEEGYYSSINPKTEIQDLTISNGVAYVDFSSDLEKGVAGSATVSFIRSQIEKTLTQFATVNSVVISIDGRVDDILQP